MAEVELSMDRTQEEPIRGGHPRHLERPSSGAAKCSYAALALIIIIQIILIGTTGYSAQRLRDMDKPGRTMIGTNEFIFHSEIPTPAQAAFLPSSSGCGEGHWFDPNENKCLDCPGGCLTCTSPTATRGVECRPCKIGYWLQAGSAGEPPLCKTCTTVCPEGQTVYKECRLTADLVCQGPGVNLPAFPGATWADIVSQAVGKTVRWWFWNGSDTINSWVDKYVVPQLKSRFQITLVRMGIADSKDFVNKVRTEKASGDTANSEIDLVWINGANFKAMSAEGLLYLDWADRLPASLYYDFKNPAIALDFGYPVYGAEFPYNQAQVSMFYNSANVRTPPTNIEGFITWIKANPGRFTYARPDMDFTGSVMARHFFYARSGPIASFEGEYSDSLFKSRAPDTWALLNELEPFLYKKPGTNTAWYPNTQAEVDTLFSQGLVDFTLSYDIGTGYTKVQAREWSNSTRALVFTTGTISNVNYLAIPFNSPNKAASLVAVNFIGDLDAVLSRANPLSWGALSAVDPTRLPPVTASQLEAFLNHPGYTVPVADLAARRLPELSSSYTSKFESEWVTKVFEQAP